MKHLFRSLVRIVASFDDDRAVAVLREYQRAEHSRRSKAYHQRSSAKLGASLFDYRSIVRDYLKSRSSKTLRKRLGRKRVYLRHNAVNRRYPVPAAGVN